MAKKRYSVMECRAYWIGVGFGAKSVGASGIIHDSFKRGAALKANVDISPQKVKIKKNR